MVAGQLELLVHILKKLKKNYLVVIAGRGESGPEVRITHLLELRQTLKHVT